MKVWVINKFLKRGIKEHELLPRDEARAREGYAFSAFGAGQALLIGVNAFYTRAEASAAADQKRRKKIDELKKQISELEAMKF